MSDIANADDKDIIVPTVKFRRRNGPKGVRCSTLADELLATNDQHAQKNDDKTKKNGNAAAAAAAGTDNNDDGDVGDALSVARALQESRVRKRGLVASTIDDQSAQVEKVVSLGGGSLSANADDGGLESVFAAQTASDERSKIDEIREAYVREKLEAEKQKKWQANALAAASSGAMLPVLGDAATDDGAGGAGATRLDDESLYKIPEHLKARDPSKAQPVPVQNWSVGIEEVELPIEYKMRNIEATEAAKQQLLLRRQQNKRHADDDEQVPANFSTRRAAQSIYHALAAPPLAGKTNAAAIVDAASKQAGDKDAKLNDIRPDPTAYLYRNAPPPRSFDANNPSAHKSHAADGQKNNNNNSNKGEFRQQATDIKAIQNFKKNQLHYHR